MACREARGDRDLATLVILRGCVVPLFFLMMMEIGRPVTKTSLFLIDCNTNVVFNENTSQISGFLKRDTAIAILPKETVKKKAAQPQRLCEA